MALLNLGRVRFNWRGAYSPTTAYIEHDCVEDDGQSYVCLWPVTGTGTGPNDTGGGTYWGSMLVRSAEYNGARDEAVAAASAASDYANAAQGSASTAGGHASAAQTARTGAEDAQGAAETAASTSEQAADTAVSQHEAKADAHTPAQVGADPAGTAATAVSQHAASRDHPTATTSDQGMLQLATSAEHIAGEAGNRAATPEGARAAFDVWIVDPERRAVEAATGGLCTIERTPTGQPCYMHILSKARCEDLEPGGALGTGVHEAFLVGGAEKSHIMVGMYAAALASGEVVSQPGLIPWVSNTFDETLAACAALGAGWHQMTAWEWAYISLWAMANGAQPTGNTDWGRSHSDTFQTAARGDNGLPGVNSGDGKTLTGYGPNAWNHNHGANGIADLVGNVWERLNLMKMVEGRAFLAPDNNYDLAESAWSDSGFDMPANQTWASQPTAGAPVSLKRALIVPNGVLDPIGNIWTTLTGERIPFRGGNRSNAGSAGLGALHLSNGRAYSGSSLGLRLSRAI